MNAAAAPDWLSPYLIPFATLSYPTAPPSNPDSFLSSNYYSVGILDACFIVTWIAVLAILREFVRLVILEPFARSWLASHARRQGMLTPQRVQPASTQVGSTAKPAASDPSQQQSERLDLLVRSRKGGQQKVKLEKITKRRLKGMTKEEWLRERSVLRFAEQGWSFVYYCFYWSFGLYLHLSLPTSPWQLTKLWFNYPHTPVAGPVKFYYLTQLASWVHQVLILNAEARRGDHFQMLSHHLITIALISLSYFANFTRVGSLIMTISDWCDIWLPFAKMLRYISLPTLCDMAFVLFLISWLVTRQILFTLVVFSTYNDIPKFIQFGWHPERGHYLTLNFWYCFLALLVALQLLICIWFWMICRVAWKVFSGQGAEDTRSDEEGESPDDEGEQSLTNVSPKPTSAHDEPKRKAR